MRAPRRVHKRGAAASSRLFIHPSPSRCRCDRREGRRGGRCDDYYVTWPCFCVRFIESEGDRRGRFHTGRRKFENENEEFLRSNSSSTLGGTNKQSLRRKNCA